MGVALRDILADYKTPVAWESLAGTAAVDAHNAIYQFLSIIRQPDGTPLMDHRGRITSHLSGILFRTVNFLEKGIKPVFVFDGKPPEFKRDTLAQRHLVRSEAGTKWQEALDRGDLKEAYKHARSSSRIDADVIQTSQALLSLLGLPWIQAPSEGEAQAAFMVLRGDARYVVSQDYDTLLFGAPTLVRNLTVSGKRKVHGRTLTVSPERIVLSEVERGLNLTREQLIQIGILVGTDFNPGARGIGPRTALKIVQKGDFEHVMQEKLPDTDSGEIMEFFLHPPVATDYSMEWRTADQEGIRKMLCDGYDFSPERIEKALGGMGAGSGQRTLDSWF